MYEVIDTNQYFNQWFSLKKKFIFLHGSTEMNPYAFVNIHLMRFSNAIFFFFFMAVKSAAQ